MATAWAIDVKDHGATGNGTTDDTAAIQAAANLVGANGGLLLLQPGGNYLISSAIYLKANTTVWIYGATVTAAWPWLGVVPSGAPPGFQVGGPFQMMFVNVNWTIDSMASPIDANIAIAGGTLKWPAPSVTGGPLGGAHSIMLRKVQTVRIKDVTFNYGGDATSLLGCVDTIVDACEAVNTANAGFDHWDGATRATVKNSTVYCLNGYGVLFNSAPTGGTESLDAEWFTCENVRVFSPTSGCAGIYIDPLGSANKIGRIMVKDCYISSSVAGVPGIVARGNPGYMQITGNTIEGVTGQTAIEFSVGGATGSTVPSGGLVKDNMFVNCSNTTGAVILANDCSVVRVEGNMAIGGVYQWFVQGQLTNGLIIGPNSALTFTSAKYYFNNSITQPILFDSDEANLRFRSNVAIVQDT